MCARVAIALSGGVDSSVSALLLKQQGHDVFALFMKNWDESDPHCPSKKDYEDVVRVCSVLEIPFYTLDFSQDYWDEVFSGFLEGLKAGVTPNPDILCNREIKFKVLLSKAISLGAEFLATGHYAKTNDGKLFQPFDEKKDQTYFLSSLKKEILEKTLFPIGDLPKNKVRDIAYEYHLATHNKKDSTGICFVGKRPFREFIEKHIPQKKGIFVNAEGEKIGDHDGLHFYTIGQRKGLGLGGGSGEGFFVADKNIETGVITLVQGSMHPLLLGKSLLAVLASSISGKSFPERCMAKIRYRTELAPCSIILDKDQLQVTFDTPQRAITPGQTIAFYLNNECLGNAVIKCKL